MSHRVLSHAYTIQLVAGAVLVNVALAQVGVRFGWWGFMFWAGVGLILGWLKWAKQ